MNHAFTHSDQRYAVEKYADLKAVPTGALVAWYNKLTGKETKKFSSREKGEAQVWSQLQKLEKVDAKADKRPTASASRPKTARAAKTDGERKVRQPVFAFSKEKTIKPPRESTKRFQVLELLRREKGATLEEITTKVWGDYEPELAKKTAYEATRLLHYQHGYGMKQDEAGRIHIVE